MFQEGDKVIITGLHDSRSPFTNEFDDYDIIDEINKWVIGKIGIYIEFGDPLHKIKFMNTVYTPYCESEVLTGDFYESEFVLLRDFHKNHQITEDKYAGLDSLAMFRQVMGGD